MQQFSLIISLAVVALIAGLIWLHGGPFFGLLFLWSTAAASAEALT